MEVVIGASKGGGGVTIGVGVWLTETGGSCAVRTLGVDTVEDLAVVKKGWFVFEDALWAGGDGAFLRGTELEDVSVIAVSVVDKVVEGCRGGWVVIGVGVWVGEVGVVVEIGGGV